jgi:hypothetical protein
MLVGAYAVIVLPTTLNADAVDNELVVRAVAAHRASLDMLKSFYAEVEILVSDGSMTGWGGRYWRDENGVRIEQTAGGTQTHALKQNGRVKVVTIAPGAPSRSNTVSMLLTDSKRYVLDVDVWEACLFSLPVGAVAKPPLPSYSLSEAVKTGE